jgi:Uri superfamily endonuclease
MDVLPVEAGTYALILSLDSPSPVVVGRMGKFDLLNGYYFYIGSAHGAGGLRARLGRHLRGDGHPQWHIDYLRQHAMVRGWGFRVSITSDDATIPLECEWSQWLACAAGATIPIPKFGASDCRSGCRAHLIYFSDPLQWHDFPQKADLTAWEGLWRDGSG